MFTITGAIVGVSVASYIAPRLLYFSFAAFHLTYFHGMRQHLTSAAFAFQEGP
jgi:hypothetical protein